MMRCHRATRCDLQCRLCGGAITSQAVTFTIYSSHDKNGVSIRFIHDIGACAAGRGRPALMPERKLEGVRVD